MAHSKTRTAFGIFTLLLAANPTSAFLPTRLVTVFGLLGTSHEVVTSDALESVFKSYFPTHARTEAIDDAFQQVVDANANVDVDEKFDAWAHFDGESFPEGQDRLTRLRSSIKSAAQSGDYTAAREYLGMSLHSIQDFYSHTNWVELGHKNIHPALGRAEPINRLSKTTPTCTTCKSKVWGSSETLRNIDVACANGCKLGDETTIKMLGTLACSLLCINPKCDANLLSSNTKLTSGYFSDEVGFEKPGPYKCSHGGPFDYSAEGFEGINKDSSNGMFSPHSEFHGAAISLATKASAQFIKDLVEREGLSVSQMGGILGIHTSTHNSKLRRRQEEIELGSLLFQSSDFNESTVSTFSNPEKRKITLPVDDSISGLVITSSSGTLDAVITQPNGQILRTSTPGSSKYIFDPTPGDWKISTTSPITVNALSSVYLSSFRFLEPNGRPGHMGYFPIDDSPFVTRRDLETEAGETNLNATAQFGNLIAVARFSSAVEAPEFEIADAHGKKLFGKKDLEWKQGEGNVFYADAEKFFDKVQKLGREDGVVVKVGGRVGGKKFKREKRGGRIGRKKLRALRGGLKEAEGHGHRH